MPIYTFECKEHGTVKLKRRMVDAGEPAGCGVCGEMMDRIFNSPQLITRPFHLLDENRAPTGQDELTQRKADDIAYERAWTPEEEG